VTLELRIADSVSTNRRGAGSCGAYRSSILVVGPFLFSAVSNVMTYGAATAATVVPGNAGPRGVPDRP
jgi:hypothetical protein